MVVLRSPRSLCALVLASGLATGGPGPDPLVPAADLAVNLSHTGAVQAGGAVTYAFAVSNAGPSDAAGPITVTDTLPAGLTYASGGGPGWSCSVSAPVVTCTHPAALPVGSAPALSVTARVDASQPAGILTNDATVAGATLDPDGANNGASDATAITAGADLAVTLSRAGPPAIGQRVTYQIGVRNAGPSDEPGPVTVTDILPGELTYVSATGSGWACGSTEQTVTCERPGTLGAGVSAAPITLIAHVASAAYPKLTNTVSVAGTGTDPVPDNGFATDVATVDALADLAVTMSHAGTPAAGDRADFLIVAVNGGPTDDPGPVVLTDVLPAGLTFVAAIGDDWDCTASDRTVECTHTGGLMMGAQADLTVTVAVGPAAVPAVRNGATITGSGTDPDPANNSVTDSMTVTAAANLRMTMSLRNSLTPAGEARYQLDAANAGPSPATGVTVVDDLPAGLAYRNAEGAGWTCVPAGTALTCVLARALAAGQGAPPLTVRTRVTAGAGTRVMNIAAIYSDQADPVPADNRARATSTVAPRAEVGAAGGPLPTTGGRVLTLVAFGVALIAAGALLVVRVRDALLYR
jgi:uncharacterized repeat protein (TIGR01451 family)